MDTTSHNSKGSDVVGGNNLIWTIVGILAIIALVIFILGAI